jgi:hypothetical protein
VIDSLGTAHQGFLVLGCLVDDLLGCLLLQTLHLNEILKQFPQYCLPVNAVHQQVIEFIANSLQLGRGLLFENHLHDLLYLFFIGREHAFGILRVS